MGLLSTELNSLFPVSYTHLDVYKRQRHYIGKKINDSDAEEFLFGKLGRKGRIAFYDAYADMQTVKTSERDVYKRQVI